jgi:peptidoglycan/xylan/chitin deacetylase (PgdA/CDA1 family)
VLTTRAAGVLRRTGAGRIARRVGRWSGVVVLNHHRVGDWSDPVWDRGLWSGSAEALAEEFALLARDCDVVAPAEIPEAVRAGRGRRVAITFDDGYRDNHDVALPALRAAGLEAAFFITTGLLDAPRVPWWDELAWIVRRSTEPGVPAFPPLTEPLAWAGDDDREAHVQRLAGVVRPLAAAARERFLDELGAAAGTGRCGEDWTERWMTWDMVRALRDAGMEIGAHTITHAQLSTLDEPGQRREIEGSLARLTEELGARPQLFSYPFGGPDAHDARTCAVLREAGVTLAFSYHGGVADARRWDPLDVPRASVGAYMGPAEIEALVTVPRAFARW